MNVLLCVCSVLLLASQAGALGVSIPELLGSYDESNGFARKVTIEVNVDPERVLSANLLLRGSVVTGALECFGSEGPELYPVDLSAWVHDPVQNAYWYVEEITPESGKPYSEYDFDINAEFTGYRNPSWGFLESGSFDIDFSAAGPMYIGICSMKEAPATIIREAVLTLRMAGEIAPIESKSWGSIKALY